MAAFVGFVCEDEVFGRENTRRLLECAKQLGFGLKVQAGHRQNGGAVAMAVEMEAASIDDVVYADDAEASLLAKSNTIATLLPGAAFYLATERYAGARAMIDRGVAVALATDYNPVTSPSSNMQMMIALACRKMNMTPAEAISASTINGAHALRRAHRAGSIEAGKDADLIMLSVPDYREIPYHFGVNVIEMTIRKGRVIYRAPEVQWPREAAGASA